MTVQEDRGVSPLIATALIIGITVVLAATGATYFLGIADQSQTQNTGEYSFTTDYSEDVITIGVAAASTGEESGFEVRVNGQKITERDSLSPGDTIQLTNLAEGDTIKIIATHEDYSQPVGSFQTSKELGTPSDSAYHLGQVSNPVESLRFYPESPRYCYRDNWYGYSSDSHHKAYIEIDTDFRKVDSMTVTVTSSSYEETLTLDDFAWENSHGMYRTSMKFDRTDDYTVTIETVTYKEKTFNDGRSRTRYINAEWQDSCYYMPPTPW